MSGYNHYDNCTCGWCLKYGRGRRSITFYASEGQAPIFTTYDSFTIPNASCPVCGANVFFYQSPMGGRVFFDELGPPWPKHPCTDNPKLPVGRSLAGQAKKSSQPAWKNEGWEPIRIRSSRMESTWHVIPVENLATRLFFDVLTGERMAVPGETVAFIKPWDANGWSKISYIELDGKAQSIIIPVFERKRHFGSARSVVTAHRKKVQGL